MIQGGKPNHIGAGCAWGFLMAPVLLFGGGWLIGNLVDLLRWLFG